MSSVLKSLTIKLIERNKNSNLSEMNKIYLDSVCRFVIKYILDLSVENFTRLSSKNISIKDLKRVIEDDNNLDNILMTKYNLKIYVMNHEFIDMLIENIKN